MIITQREASRLSPSSFMHSSLAHVRLAPRADDGSNGVEGGGARDVERVPVLATPGEVPRVLRDEDRAEVLAGRRDHPDPAGTGHPDVAALVALHPVRDAFLDDARPDALEEHPAVRDRPVGCGVVD